MEKIKVLIPPKDFLDYEWDDDFKVIMFSLEFTLNEMSGSNPPKFAKELAKEWGYKNTGEIYDKLWGRFKYYRGDAFNKKFKVVESHVNCPRCKNTIRMAEIKPGYIVGGGEAGRTHK